MIWKAVEFNFSKAIQDKIQPKRVQTPPGFNITVNIEHGAGSGRVRKVPGGARLCMPGPFRIVERIVARKITPASLANNMSFVSLVVLSCAIWWLALSHVATSEARENPFARGRGHRRGLPRVCF